MTTIPQRFNHNIFLFNQCNILPQIPKRNLGKQTTLHLNDACFTLKKKKKSALSVCLTQIFMLSKWFVIFFAWSHVEFFLDIVY